MKACHREEHCDAAISGIPAIATAPLQALAMTSWQTIWTSRAQVQGGYIEVSRAPGFGIELDAEMLRRYRVG